MWKLGGNEYILLTNRNACIVKKISVYIINKTKVENLFRIVFPRRVKKETKKHLTRSKKTKKRFK